MATTEDPTDTTACPTCDREFGTLRGMKNHHVQAHGESIAGALTECDNCGEEYRAQYNNVARSENDFCDKECWGEWQSENRHGEDHWCYNRVEVPCEVCGETVECTPGRLERNKHQFCGRNCYGEWRSGLFSSEFPQWEGGPVTVVCHNCGQFFGQRQSVARAREKSFCCRDCFEDWASENHVGEKNPNWRGGECGGRGQNWRLQRRAAIARATEQCELCGLDRDGHRSLHGEDLHVHHKIPYRMFDDDRQANKLDNLIVVCRSCHFQVEPVSATKAPENISESDDD